jgi:hypothetical protein
VPSTSTSTTSAVPGRARAAEIDRLRANLIDLALAEAAERIRVVAPNAAAITVRVGADFIHLFAVHLGAAPTGGDIAPFGTIMAASSSLLPLRELTDLLSLARACGLDPAKRGWRREAGRRVWWEADLDAGRRVWWEADLDSLATPSAVPLLESRS